MTVICPLYDRYMTVTCPLCPGQAFSYISDVAAVIGSSVLFPNAYNEDFFVGNDEPFSVKALAAMVSEVCPEGTTHVLRGPHMS